MELGFCMFHNRNHIIVRCNELLKSEASELQEYCFGAVSRKEGNQDIMHVRRTSDTTWNMIRFAGPNALMAKLMFAHLRFSNLA